jgi:hypothetical protein
MWVGTRCDAVELQTQNIESVLYICYHFICYALPRTFKIGPIIFIYYPVLPINYKDQKGKNKDLIRTQFWQNKDIIRTQNRAFTEK